MKGFIGMVLFLGMALCLDGEAISETLNRVVAVVNKHVVTLHELNSRFKILTGLNPSDLKVQDEAKFLETRKKVLDMLMEEKIAQDRIRELGLKVSKEEVDGAIEKVRKDNAITQEELAATLRERGTTFEAYREIIKNELERMRLIHSEIQSKIIIRDEKVREYFDKHPEKFSTEERVRLASIALKVTDPKDSDEVRQVMKRAEGILARIEKGEDFAKLSKQFSEGPGADEGGDLGYFKVARLDPELLKIIQELPEGGVSGPVLRSS